MNKVIFITGASSGLGFSVALKLAAQGHCVYAGIRNLSKSEQMTLKADEYGVKLNIIECEVTSTESVNEAIKTIINEQGRIDALINNAGIGFIKTTEQASEEEVAQVMDTNFMGVMRTTKAVLPHMRKAQSGHIVNISSVGGLVGQPFNEVYCASKFALEGYTESLACYIKPFFNIHFSVVEPGGIQSEFAATTLSGYDPQTLHNDYQPIFERYVGNAKQRADNPEATAVYQSSDEVASCVTAIVNNEKPPLRIRTSDWAKDLCQLKTQADPNGDIGVNKVYEQFLA